MRIAYADPPYIGQSKKHYGRAEVNHEILINHLANDFPDGWALSCSSPSLPELLPKCPTGVRVGAWVKPFASFKPGVNPAYAWEPVVWIGGRNKGRDEPTTRDWCSCSITLKRGLAGAKPEGFSFWLFALLGMRLGDELVDMFPGTGGVTSAWEAYQRQFPLKFSKWA